VVFRVSITGQKKTEKPAILTATTPAHNLKAEARIRITYATQTRERPSGPQYRGTGLDIQETELPDGIWPHSKTIGSTVNVNKSCPHYKALTSDEERIFYDAICYGKEHIAKYDPTGKLNEYLEKFLYYLFEFQTKMRKKPKRKKR
jgi:hypothetical protein